jgi:hypothetical protein
VVEIVSFCSTGECHSLFFGTIRASSPSKRALFIAGFARASAINIGGNGSNNRGLIRQWAFACQENCTHSRLGSGHNQNARSQLPHLLAIWSDKPSRTALWDKSTEDPFEFEDHNFEPNAMRFEGFRFIRNKLGDFSPFFVLSIHHFTGTPDYRADVRRFIPKQRLNRRTSTLGHFVLDTFQDF